MKSWLGRQDSQPDSQIPASAEGFPVPDGKSDLNVDRLRGPVKLSTRRRLHRVPSRLPLSVEFPMRSGPPCSINRGLPLGAQRFQPRQAVAPRFLPSRRRSVGPARRLHRSAKPRGKIAAQKIGSARRNEMQGDAQLPVKGGEKLADELDTF